MTPLLFFISAFGVGLVRGTSVCVLICAPGMISYIIGKKYTTYCALKMGMIFSIPRIIILSLLGAIVGYLVFKVGHLLPSNYIMFIGSCGYLILGIFLVGFGIYAWLGKPLKIKMPKFKFKLKIQKSSVLFLIWGSILSIACIGEITIIEGAVLSGASATFGSTELTAIVFGTLTMFVFAMGATVPILIVTAISGKLSNKIHVRTISLIKDVGALLMIMVGGMIVGIICYNIVG